MGYSTVALARPVDSFKGDLGVSVSPAQTEQERVARRSVEALVEL